MRRLNGLIISAAVAAVIGAIGENAEAAGAKAQTRAYADTGNFVLANFEQNMQSTQWNGYWFNYTDKYTPSAADSTVMGNSTLTSLDSNGYPFYDTAGYYDARTYPIGRTGETDSHSYHMAFALGDRKLGCGTGCSYDPYVGWGLNFTTYQAAPHDTVDLTGATAISWWAKSDSDTVTVSFTVSTHDTTPNSADYAQTFKIGPTWAKYTCNLVPSADFKQPSYAAHKPFDPRYVFGIGWGFNRGQNSKKPTDGIDLDDIVIEHWTDIPPESDAIRAASRAAAARAGWRLQVQGSQIRLVRPDGDKLVPLNLNGRALPTR